MNAKVIFLLKRDLDYKLKQISNKDWEKKVWIFLGLSVRGNPDKTPLTPSSFADPLWFASLCWRPLLSLFSEALRISFSLCSSLDIRLFTYAFSCSLLRSSRRILPILASFLTFLRVFLDSLYAFYLLLSLIALSLSFQPILLKTLLHELKFFPPVDKALALSVLLLCGLNKNFKILRIIVQTTTSPFSFPAQNAGGKLFAHAVHIY